MAAIKLGSKALKIPSKLGIVTKIEGKLFKDRMVQPQAVGFYLTDPKARRDLERTLRELEYRRHRAEAMARATRWLL